MSIISKGNHKLAKSVGIFNLPTRSTCPGATATCAAICYARKPERYSKQAVALRARNYELSKSEIFVDTLIKEITAAKTRLFRFHEAGDVYSIEYFNKICQVCKALPDVKFLMYTKSFFIAPLEKPENLQVYWSVDKSTREAVPAGVTARLLLKGEVPVPGEVTCNPAGLDKHYCGAVCTTCFQGKNNVYFNQH